jgi:hypothetical protein
MAISESDGKAAAALDARLDAELEDTFPASDPPSALLREPEEPPKPA